MFKSLKGANRSLLCTVITSVIVISICLIIALVAIPLIVDAVLKANLVVEEGGQAWDRFVELPFPLDFKIYMFNVTNAEEVLLQGATPNLTEVGPYIFRNYRKKFDIKKEDDAKISFYQNQTFFFDKVRTGTELSLTDRITNVNFLVLGVLQLIENSKAPVPFSVEEVLPFVLDDPSYFTTFDVGKFLFEGTTFCRPERSNAPAKLVCLLVMFLNLKMVTYHDDLSMSYALFSFKNFTDDGRFTLNTGANDIADLGKITKWNDNERMDIWNGDECNKVEGIDQTMFPPYIESGSSVKIFNTDLCRAIELKFAKEEQFRDVDTFRLTLSAENFYVQGNGSANESCYCSDFTRDMDGEKSCFLDGVQDVYPCLGIPGLVSLPHFLGADERYLESVNGLSPNKSLHDSYLNIQPFLGIPLTGYIGIQINLISRPVMLGGEISPITKDLTPAVIPIIWLQQGVTITEDYFSLVTMVLELLYWLEIGKWIVIAVIFIPFLIRILWLVRSVAKNSSRDEYNEPSQPRITAASIASSSSRPHFEISKHY